MVAQTGVMVKSGCRMLNDDAHANSLVYQNSHFWSQVAIGERVPQSKSKSKPTVSRHNNRFPLVAATDTMPRWLIALGDSDSRQTYATGFTHDYPLTMLDVELKLCRRDSE